LRPYADAADVTEQPDAHPEAEARGRAHIFTPRRGPTSPYHAAGMGHARFAWLTALGVMLTGWLTAHCLGHWLAVRDAGVRHHPLEGSGHAYFDAIVVLTLAATLVVVGFIGRVVVAPGRPTKSAPPTILFFLAPLGFIIQEHLERGAQQGALAYDAVLEPAVLLGFLLQIPFALASFFVTRALLVSADALSLRLGEPCWPRLVRILIPAPGATGSALRLAPLAFGRCERAPPPAPPPPL
jgi:hypothetical protein